MISQFDLQTQAGQLWPDIKEHLEVKDAEISTLKDSAATTAKRTAQALGAAAALLGESDVGKLHAGIQQIIAFAQAEEVERRRAELKAQLEALG